MTKSVSASALGAALALTLASAAVTTIGPQKAIAQEGALIAKLVELSERKESPHGLAPACANLGLTRECLVYQLAYKMDDGTVHSFNQFTEQPGGTLRVIIYKRKDKEGDFYLVGRDGSLIRAMSFKRNPDPIWSPLPSAQARPGLEAELSYWRAKLPDVESRPDRKK
jgi:hypothetical protein